MPVCYFRKKTHKCSQNTWTSNSTPLQSSKMKVLLMTDICMYVWICDIHTHTIKYNPGIWSLLLPETQIPQQLHIIWINIIKLLTQVRSWLITADELDGWSDEPTDWLNDLKTITKTKNAKNTTGHKMRWSSICYQHKRTRISFAEGGGNERKWKWKWILNTNPKFYKSYKELHTFLWVKYCFSNWLEYNDFKRFFKETTNLVYSPSFNWLSA